MNSADYRLKKKIDINIVKFWLHLESLPDNNIATQCLYLSKLKVWQLAINLIC